MDSCEQATLIFRSSNSGIADKFARKNLGISVNQRDRSRIFFPHKITSQTTMLPIKEDLRTEFKQSFTDDVIVALVAFANAKGGSVYVGVRDDGSACGATLGKETIQKWLNDIRQKTEPSMQGTCDCWLAAAKHTAVGLSVGRNPRDCPQYDCPPRLPVVIGINHKNFRRPYPVFQSRSFARQHFY